MAALEVLALNTTVPRIEAPQTGDTYTFPRAADIPLGTAALPAVAFTGDLNTGIFSPTADTFAVATGGTERMRLDSAGNLGLGVAPSAWASSLSWRAIQQTGGSVWSAAATDFGLAHNSHYTAGGGWTYTNSAAAARHYMAGATHTWSVAASGTANTAVTWTDAMRLHASGGLSLGNASDFGTGVFCNTGGWVLGGTPGGPGGGSTRYISGGGAAVDWYHNVPTGGSFAFSRNEVVQMALNSVGNLGLGTQSFGSSAVKVFAIANGTEPTTGPANTVQFYSVDRSAGNTIPGIYCEGTGVTDAAITNVTVTNKIAIKVNGTIYYLLATTSAA